MMISGFLFAFLCVQAKDEANLRTAGTSSSEKLVNILAARQNNQRAKGPGPLSFMEVQALDGTLMRKIDDDYNKMQDKMIGQLKGGVKGAQALWGETNTVMGLVDKTEEEIETWLKDNNVEMGKLLEKDEADYARIKLNIETLVEKKKKTETTDYAATMKVIAATSTATSALYALEKSKFNEMKKTLKVSMATVKDIVKKHSKGVYDQAKAVAFELKTGTAVSAANREGIAFSMGLKIKSAEQKADDKIKSVDAETKTLMEDVAEKIDGNVNVARQVGEFLIGTDKKLETLKTKVMNKLSKQEQHKLQLWTDHTTEEMEVHANLQKKTSQKMNTMQRGLSGLTKELARDMHQLSSENGEAADMLGSQVDASVQEIKDGATSAREDVDSNLAEGDKALGETEDVMKDAIQNADGKLGDLNNAAKEEGSAIAASANALKSAWATDAAEAQGALTKGMEDGKKAVNGMLADQSKKALSAHEQLKADLNKINSAADMGLGELQNKLGAFSAELDASYDAGSDWQSDFDGLTSEFGDDVEQMEGTSGRMLEGLGAVTAKGNQMALATVARFGKDMMSSLQDMQNGFGDSIGTLGGEGMGSISHAQKYFKDKMSASDKGIDGLLGASTDNMAKFEGLVANDNVLFSKGNKMNMAMMTELMGGALPSLTAIAAEEADATHDQTSAFSNEMISAQGSFSDELRASIKQGKENLQGDLNSEEDRQKGEVKAWLATTSTNIDGKTRELSALELAMQNGGRQYANEADRIAASLGAVKSAAKKMNARINAQFDVVKHELSEKKLMSATSEAELKEVIEQRERALAHLADQQIKGMGEEQRAKFEKAEMERQAAIEKIMNDSSLTLAAKQAAILATDAKMTALLNELQEEVLITDEEVAGIHAEQQKTSGAVKLALMDAHNAVSSTELIAAGTAEEQQALLDKRALALKNAAMGAAGHTSAEMEAAIDKVANEANDRIQMILAADHLSDAEKQTEIAKIDAFTREAISAIAMKEVAEANQLEGFVTAENEFDSDIAGEMFQLEGVLKDEQYQWLKAVMHEKGGMAKNANEVVAVVDKLLADIEGEQGDITGDLTEAQTKRQKALKTIRLRMRSLSAEQTQASKDALEVAKMSENAAEAAQAKTESTMTGMDQQLNNVEEQVSEESSQLSKEIEEDKDERIVGMQHEKRAAVNSTADLAGMIASVTESLATSAINSSQYQQKLEDKTAGVQEMLDAESRKTMNAMQGEMDRINRDQNAIAGAADRNKKYEQELTDQMNGNMMHGKDVSSELENSIKTAASESNAASAKAKAKVDGSLEKENRDFVEARDKDVGQQKGAIIEVTQDVSVWMDKAGMQAKKISEEERAAVEAVQAGVGPRLAAIGSNGELLQQEIVALQTTADSNENTLDGLKDKVAQLIAKDDMDYEKVKNEQKKADIADELDASVLETSDAADAAFSLDDLDSEIDGIDATAQSAEESNEAILSSLPLH